MLVGKRDFCCRTRGFETYLNKRVSKLKFIFVYDASAVQESFAYCFSTRCGYLYQLPLRSRVAKTSQIFLKSGFLKSILKGF